MAKQFFEATGGAGAKGCPTARSRQKKPAPHHCLIVTRVSESSSFGAAPDPGNFFPKPAPAPGDIFKKNWNCFLEMPQITFNTCIYRFYFFLSFSNVSLEICLLQLFLHLNF